MTTNSHKISIFARYLVDIGCIPKICDLLTVQDPRVLLVTLEGLDNILRVGCDIQKVSPTSDNPFVIAVEEANG